MDFTNTKKPSHYATIGKKEVLDVIEDTLSAEEFYGFCLGNIIKYRMRAGKKGGAMEDLAKADHYEKIWYDYEKLIDSERHIDELIQDIKFNME